MRGRLRRIEYKKSDTLARYKWYESVQRRLKNRRELLVLFTIVHSAAAVRDTTGQALRFTTLQGRTGLGRVTVGRALNTLEEMRLVTREWDARPGPARDELVSLAHKTPPGGGDTVAGHAEWRSLALGSDTCVNGRAGVSNAPAADKKVLAAGAPIRRDVGGCTLGSMLVTAVGDAAFGLPDPAAQTQPPVPPRTGIEHWEAVAGRIDADNERGGDRHGETVNRLSQ